MFPDGTNWQEQLRRIAHELRRVCLPHPNAAPLLVTGPLSTPLGLRPAGTLRPVEQIVGILIGAGFAPADALRIYRAFYGYLYGHVLNELQELIADPEENEALLRLGLQRLPMREFPHLRRVAPELLEYDGEQGHAGQLRFKKGCYTDVVVADESDGIGGYPVFPQGPVEAESAAVQPRLSSEPTGHQWFHAQLRWASHQGRRTRHRQQPSSFSMSPVVPLLPPAPPR
ncbi:TetR/AcrR family transcriptional regulator C-terminal domain-containing protein [Arthrobacter bambusae]|uniref:TetR/AcrR family transcriptional regulator C-terminal domain-containing protein n=1 Tax=Arthrobacter bambusae TaxID=1338426 RepID=UPI002786A7A4|nr:TetR/AcrR family transcriptional regulator C-terminal domain-containing protein [Arthrobacter bambusae]MDQ0028667.1 hypothetical protein [Arthrobacter bambusae]MDQ0096539.1 hypothetical protein [Arthrobacter bambusae]